MSLINRDVAVDNERFLYAVKIGNVNLILDMLRSGYQDVNCTDQKVRKMPINENMIKTL